MPLNFKITVMKKQAIKISAVFFIFMVLTCFTVAADPAVNMADLSITIKTLADAVAAGSPPEPGTQVILNGTAISRMVIEPDPANFTGQIILANGSWINSDQVVMNKCIVLLSGAEFSKTIPVRRSRTVDPEEIVLNSEILIAGYFAGTAETEEGLLPVVVATGIRKL